MLDVTRTNGISLSALTEQAAHIHNAVDSVAEADLGRVLRGAEIVGFGGIKDNYGQIGSGKGIDRLK
jgi:hypothetical protein